MTHGFVIRRLSLEGRGLQSAHMDFRKGLNVISGPSDTGKTYIAQCIDFVMGSKRPPKQIPQAEGYETVVLSLETGAGSFITLSRSLRGGDVRLAEAGKPDKLLSAKHTADNSESVSHLLLGLSGLTGNKIRTNQRGETRSLSFRDIIRLSIVDEESVISAKSPVLTGQYTTRTAECGVFRLLLTRSDDSSVIAREDLKVSRIRNEGRMEVIQTLSVRAKFQLEQIGTGADTEDEASLTTVRERLSSLEEQLHEATNELVVDQQIVAEIEEKRRASWTELRRIESKIGVLSELQSRFSLLDSQYHSDLRRLATISETGSRLSQLTAERCPVCGADADHQDHEHRDPTASPESVSLSCEAEASKIRTLLLDLAWPAAGFTDT